MSVEKVTVLNQVVVGSGAENNQKISAENKLNLPLSEAKELKVANSAASVIKTKRFPFLLRS